MYCLQYRNPWDGVRIGRLLEDMDSLAGFVAFDHADDGDPATRPPLLVTATVEAIRVRGTEFSLAKDMKASPELRLALGWAPGPRAARTHDSQAPQLPPEAAVCWSARPCCPQAPERRRPCVFCWRR